MATHPSDFPGFGVSVCLGYGGGPAMTWSYAIAAVLAGAFLGWHSAWVVARLFLAEQGRRLLEAQAERDAASAGLGTQTGSGSEDADQ